MNFLFIKNVVSDLQFASIGIGIIFFRTNNTSLSLSFDSILDRKKTEGQGEMQETVQQRRTASTSTAPAATTVETEVPTVGSLVWAAGRSRAQQAFNLYANIDYLRPFFDVEPKEVLHRLTHSLIPQWPMLDHNVKAELYGPSMIVFTLAAILIYQMKLASHSVQDGTLIGTSFLICFGYWIGSSFAISSVSFVCNTHLSLMQILSLNGYALFSHCVVLFLATFIHTGHDHLFFYGLWFLIGGIAAVRMMTIIMLRTYNPRYRILLGIFVVAIHMLFLLYLHFAYHELAENVAHSIDDRATIVIESVLPVAAKSPNRVVERNS